MKHVPGLTPGTLLCESMIEAKMTRISKLIIFIAIVITAPLVMAQLNQAITSDTVTQARSLLANGQLEQALSQYHALAVQHPESVEVIEGLGSAQLLNQQYREAIATYQKAISLGETSGRSFMGMGMAYLHLGMFSKAEAALKEAKSRQESPNENLDDVLGWLEKKQGMNAGGMNIH